MRRLVAVDVVIIALELLLANPPPARAASFETGVQEDALMNNAKAFVGVFEKGDAKAVIPPDDTPASQVRYTNVHVKKDGQRVLQSVREAPYTPPGNHENLRTLEWAIGEWVDEEDRPEVGHVASRVVAGG